MSFFNRLGAKNFDLRNVRWNRKLAAKVALAIVAILVALWILQTVVGIALSIAPWVIIALALYVGYRVLTSRDEDLAAEQETRMEAPQKEEQTVAEQKYEQIIERVRAAEEQPPEEVAESMEDEFIDGNEVIARLAVKEERTGGRVTDEILAQIEERKRRLQNRG